MFGVQFYKNNARALLSRILSILNLDWLQHAHSVRGVYEGWITIKSYFITAQQVNKSWQFINGAVYLWIWSFCHYIIFFMILFWKRAVLSFNLYQLIIQISVLGDIQSVLSHSGTLPENRKYLSTLQRTFSPTSQKSKQTSEMRE